MNTTPANQNIPDDLIDKAFEVMNAELDHWQIVGPQKGKSITGADAEFYTATRSPEQSGYAMIMAEPAPEAEVRFQHFKTKPHAVAYVQWNGIKAVLSHAEIQLGIMKLAEGSA